MILEIGIYEYLSGSDAVRTDRLNARKSLQALVGDEIYLARRSRVPCGESSEYALLIRRLGRFDYADNWGDAGCSLGQVEFTCLGKDNPHNLLQLTEYVRICCTAFSGMMGDVEIVDSGVLREGLSRPQSPIDASDAWGYQNAIDIQFLYKQQAVAFGA